jgi:phage repressor protein C with HTH and peptisase S24 domain
MIGLKLAEGKTYRQIGSECGINHVSIGQYHKGITPDAKNLALLAKYLRVEFSDILSDLDSYDLSPIPPPSGLIPVISMASANGDGPCWEDAYPVGHGMQMIHRPHDVIDPKAFGVKVDGDSMSPKYEDGDIVVVCPQKQVTSGMPVVVKLADGRVMIKRIRYVNDYVLLESINSNYEPIFVKRDEVEFAYKIVWTKGG